MNNFDNLIKDLVDSYCESSNLKSYKHPIHRMNHNLKSILSGANYKTLAISKLYKDLSYQSLIIEFEDANFYISIYMYTFEGNKYIFPNYIENSYMNESKIDFKIFIKSLFNIASNSALKYDNYNIDYLLFKNIIYDENIINIFDLKSNNIIKFYEKILK